MNIAKIVSDGVDAAKGGAAIATHAALQPRFAAGEIPEESHYAYAWIVYYALHQTPDNAVAPRKRLLAEYLSLHTPRPHKLHSMILTEAVRLARDASNLRSDAPENSFSLLKFVSLWDLSNLRPGDWKRKDSPDGTPMASTVERLLKAAVAEAEAQRTVPAAEVLEVLKQAMEQFPDSFNLLAAAATISQLRGRGEKAVELLKKAVLLAPGKFYLWSRLADLVADPEQLKLRIALLHKALDAPDPENLKGKVHLALAEAWAQAGSASRALHELQAYRAIQERNGWNLSPRHARCLKAIPDGTEAKDPAADYQRLAPVAAEFIYSQLPQIRVRKTYHKAAATAPDRYGRMRHNPVAWRVTDAEGHNYWLTPSHFGIDETLPTGTELLIRQHASRTLTAQIV